MNSVIAGIARDILLAAECGIAAMSSVGFVPFLFFFFSTEVSRSVRLDSGVRVSVGLVGWFSRCEEGRKCVAVRKSNLYDAKADHCEGKSFAREYLVIILQAWWGFAWIWPLG